LCLPLFERAVKALFEKRRVIAEQESWQKVMFLPRVNENIDSRTGEHTIKEVSEDFWHLVILFTYSRNSEGEGRFGMDLGAIMRSREDEVLIGVRVVSEQCNSNGSFTHLAWDEHKLRLVLISSVNYRF
jgi:hypothetical protein